MSTALLGRVVVALPDHLQAYTQPQLALLQAYTQPQLALPLQDFYLLTLSCHSCNHNPLTVQLNPPSTNTTEWSVT